ncbi:MAG TPA: chromosomal replication initiator protein DnaA [Geminicoccaceae bacterium]|nr:chromosomal replication initiator protein DnaA [Geminicoccaceae bacterium]
MNLQPKSAPPALDQQWSQVQGMLRAEFGETTYRTWLAPLQLSGIEGDRVLLAVPTRFLRDWVAAHYADRIRVLWRRLNPAVGGVALVVGAGAIPKAADPPPALPAPGRPPPLAAPPLGAAPPPSAEAAQPESDIGAPLDPRCTFESFVVGPPNELAFAAAKRIAEFTAPPFNPLFVYGGVGLGKTHLMHAVAWQIRRQNPGRKVVYLSAEKFMYQFIKALRFKDTMSFKELFRSADVLMVDDVQFIGGKGSTQEEFFHTFNTLIDRGRQIVVSADRSPSELMGLEERIRSRLGWGLVVDIHPTTYELRREILRRKAALLAHEVEVPDQVLDFLAMRITANVRELEGALNRVVAQATLVGRAITLAIAQDVLQDLLRAHERRITIEDIQKRVAEHYGLRMGDMLSARRARAVARPRQVAMYLTKQLTPRSLPEIGRKFGGRDHTTVMHAIRRIEELRAVDAALNDDIELLRRLLTG